MSVINTHLWYFAELDFLLIGPHYLTRGSTLYSDIDDQTYEFEVTRPETLTYIGKCGVRYVSLPEAKGKKEV